MGITEDRFGVMQKELPTILTSLLTLDQKMFGPRRIGGMMDGDIRLRQELKGAVKAGLYRIAIQFGEHIQAVPLTREQSSKMINYQKLLEACALSSRSIVLRSHKDIHYKNRIFQTKSEPSVYLDVSAR